MKTISIEDSKLVGRFVRKPGYYEARIISAFTDQNMIYWVLRLINTKVKYEDGPYIVVDDYGLLGNTGYFINSDELGWQ